MLGDREYKGETKKRQGSWRPKTGDKLICVSNKEPEDTIGYYTFPIIGQMYEVMIENSRGSPNWVHTHTHAYLLHDFIPMPETKLTKLLFK